MGAESQHSFLSACCPQRHVASCSVLLLPWLGHSCHAGLHSQLGAQINPFLLTQQGGGWGEREGSVP